MMNRQLLVVTLLILPVLPAQAAKLDNLGGLVQSEFRLLSEDLGAALSYKPLTPAEPLGLTGFDIGVQFVYTDLANTGVYKTATSSSDVNFVLPQIHAYKGLPLGFDVGLSYAAVPDSNIRLWGAELRYAILAGSTTTPAIGIRASYTSLEGVDQMTLHTTGLDVSISKGFAFFTPYAGVGSVWVRSNGTISSGEVSYDTRLNKYYLGFNMNFAVINIAIEGDKTGDATSYGAKFGWRF